MQTLHGVDIGPKVYHAHGGEGVSQVWQECKLLYIELRKFASKLCQEDGGSKMILKAWHTLWTTLDEILTPSVIVTLSTAPIPSSAKYTKFSG